MPLSEYESRVLERLEHEITITDPELSQWLATGKAALPQPTAGTRAGRVFAGLGRRRPDRPALRSVLHRPSVPPIVLVAILLMVLGAVLVGVAAINGWFVVLGVAAAAYVGGLVPLVLWNRRRGGSGA